MGTSFDGVDFYPTDDALRGSIELCLPISPFSCFHIVFISFFENCFSDGLDPIDFDGLQILTNSTLVTDPSTEDHFRLDRM